MQTFKKVKSALVLFLTFSAVNAHAQTRVSLDIDSAKITISRHVYGHFAEHVSRVIYDGIFVGKENTTIPQTNGVRNDVIRALRDLKIPNLRWPGGCFADTYHWKDAIGPQRDRTAIENISWGNYREDNSFGTHEFLDLCESLGAEPYLASNMNTGSVQEAVEWEQYVNHPNGSSALTDLREKNGRSKPWSVKFWGIGNESWDCGGNMSAEYYVSLYKRFATAMTDYYNSKHLFRVAVGPGFPDYHWTETVMKEIPARRIEGLSIHHYAVNWNHKSSSTNFTDAEYFDTMERAWFMESFIKGNCAVMDKYDPRKRVALVVDEWGGWYDIDTTGHGALYQQNTIRDAMIAGLTLNIFNNHADRVRMANLAQMVNALQSVILTRGQTMILTPTYYVMQMYNVHQDALLVPSRVEAKDFVVRDKKIQAVSVSASIDKGRKLHVSLTNIDSQNNQQIVVDLKGFRATRVSGRILTSARVQDHNTFEHPTSVVPASFDGASLSDGAVSLTMPPISVVVLELTD